MLTRQAPQLGEWMYHEHPTFHFMNNLSASLMPVGWLVIMFGVFQVQRAQTSRRFEELEKQIAELKKPAQG